MASKRTSPTRLLITVFIAVLLFVGLALAEDFGSRYLKRRAREDKAAQARQAVNKAVAGYTETLIKSYDQTSPNLLRGKATDKQITKIRLYLAYNHFEKKQKLAARLDRQDFQTAAVRGRRATVRARETWSYRYLDEATGAVVEDQTEMLRVTYRLRKEKSRWLVDSLTAKSAN